jgi:predicted dehydrogenase
VFRITDDASASGGITIPASMLLGDLDAAARNRSIVYEEPKLETVNAIAREHEEFVHAVRSGSPPPVTGEEAAAALKIAEEIVEQIERRDPEGAHPQQ